MEQFLFSSVVEKYSRICTKIYMNNEIDRKRLDEINEIIMKLS